MYGAMAAGNANATRIRELVHLRRPNQSKQLVSLLGLLLRAGHPAHPHLGRVPRRRAHRGAHVEIVRNDTSLALSSWVVVAWFLECIARKRQVTYLLTPYFDWCPGIGWVFPDHLIIPYFDGKRPVFSPKAGSADATGSRTPLNGFARTGEAPTTAYGRGPAALACCGRPAKRAAPARGSGGAAPEEASCLRAVARTGEQPRLEQGTRSDAAGCAGKSFDSSVEWSSVEERRGRRRGRRRASERGEGGRRAERPCEPRCPRPRPAVNRAG